MKKNLLTKQQRDAGLGTFEDDHNLYLEDYQADKEEGDAKHKREDNPQRGFRTKLATVC